MTLRTIHSFVRRSGRITRAQQHALEHLWDTYVLPEKQAIDWHSAFARPTQQQDAPRHLEIGFGMGETLWSMAQTHPEHDYLGIEVHKAGVGRVLLQLDQLDLHNVRICCDDAVHVLSEQLPHNSLDAVYIYFPDPWPKKRHHKRRLIQPAFVKLLAQVLKPQALLHLATDWENYAEHMLDVLEDTEDFYNLHGKAQFAPRNPERPLTKFEKRGQRLGHLVWDLSYRRR